MPSKTAQDVAQNIRQIWKSYRPDCEVVFDSDHIKRDAEVAAEIQSFADSQNAELETQMKDMSANYKNEIAELRAENEKLKTELRDYMSDSLLNAALEAEHGE